MSMEDMNRITITDAELAAILEAFEELKATIEEGLDLKVRLLLGEDASGVDSWDLQREDFCVWNHGYSAGIEVATKLIADALYGKYAEALDEVEYKISRGREEIVEIEAQLEEDDE